jgi:hypothetical protein
MSTTRLPSKINEEGATDGGSDISGAKVTKPIRNREAPDRRAT